MNEFWQYQFQSGITLIFLFGIYWFLLRKETFFKVHRFFLLAAGIISLVLPLINFSILIGVKSFSPVQIVNSGYRYVEAALVMNPVRITGEQQGGITVFQFIWGVYLAGVFLLSGRLVYQVLLITRSIRQTETRILRDIPVNVNNRIPAPFSFFGRIFIPFGILKHKHFEEILIHEAEHLKQKHSWDLLFIELFCIFQWFNPIVWMVGRAVRETHEYLADQGVLRQGTIRTSYQAVLLEHTLGVPVFGLSHYFNNSISKKRIIMMKKQSSPNFRKWRVLFILPVILLLSAAFTKPVQEIKTQLSGSLIRIQNESVIKGKIFADKTGKPLPGASVIVMSTTTGTVSDSNGEFSLELDKAKVQLVISYVGYKTLIVEAKDGVYLDIRLKRGVYKVDLDQQDFKDNNKTSQPDKPAKRNNDEVFFIVEDMPHFPGGNQALQEYLVSNTQYPKKALKMNISGKVIVRFLVDKQGNIKDVAIEKGVDSLLDQEAMRVVSNMPKWKPGEQRGKPVEVTLSVPVGFKLK